jgi:RHH-type proline utilization regulon transcriptional repressor/proline dehydrogenase/delta 1-pyrroline-5-carboxylate dehydrogenase
LKEFHFPLTILDTDHLAPHWGKDTGYQLLNPRPSLISVAGRVSRFEHFGRSFLEQYELFMGTVNEKDKAQLQSFVEWVKENLGHYLMGKHMNFVIPGQLSYNDKSIIKDAGLIVAVSGRPSVKSIHYLFGILALGCGVSVACVTEEAYQTWKSILDLAWKAGFSKTNIDCTLVSPESMQKIFKEPHYSFAYAGHFVQYHEQLYKNIFDGKALTENMRLILSEIDGVSLAEPTQILDQFVWTRSLAINTMRHGAPLELNA